MIDTNAIRERAVGQACYYDIAALCDEVDRLLAELDAKSQIFDAERTCGELSCDECNARYAEAKREVYRLRAELQAERAMRLAEQSTIFAGDGRRFVEYRGDTK